MVWNRQPNTKEGAYRYSVTPKSAHQLERFDGSHWVKAKAP